MSSVLVSAASGPESAAASLAWFSLRARAEPGVMPRVLELFAKRGLVPDKWHSLTGGADNRMLTIDVQIGGLEDHTVEYVANCMRGIAGVEAVVTAETHPAG
jgi:acetolactate synthase small subunit